MARGFDWGALIVWVCSLSFILSFIVLIPVLVALFSSPSSPSFSINLFDNQALAVTTADDSPANLTIHFDLKLKNKNFAIGLHYPDPLKITFSYFPNVSMMVILAEYKLDSFYQGNGKTRHVRDVVETSSFPTALEGTDMMAFRVDLVGAYRYKKAGSNKHEVELGCVMGVNYTTSQKTERGFIGMRKPGLDSKLEPPSDEYY